LEPVLGIVELSDFRRFVMADLPGLIEGAHKGVGLGFDFLRHIERTALIVHLLDVLPADGSDPLDNYHAIRRELEQHSRVLAAKPEVIVANKIDLDPDGTTVRALTKKLHTKIISISAVTGQGTRELSELLWQKVKEIKAQAQSSCDSSTDSLDLTKPER
jgi:GTP-binding protein